MTAPDFMTRYGPVPRELADPFWQRARGKGTYTIELTPDAPHAEGVALYHATRTDDGTIKATVLLVNPATHQWEMTGCEADKPTVERWLRTKGIPCVRIGRLHV